MCLTRQEECFDGFDEMGPAHDVQQYSPGCEKHDAELASKIRRTKASSCLGGRSVRPTELPSWLKGNLNFVAT